LRSFVTLTQHHQRLALRQMLKDHQEKVQAANSSNIAA
jgi:hypothetical protein